MKIVFCGVGALGSTAVLFCRNLDATLVFIDDDRVESKNLLAQNFVKQSLGKNKAQALRLQLQNFFSVNSEAVAVRLVEQNVNSLLDDANLIVDCFDNASSRLLLSAFVKESGTALLHAGISADGTFGLVRWDKNFTVDEEDEQGQASCEGGEHLPLIGLLASSIARTIQEYVNTGEMQEYMVSLNGSTQYSR
ncbi:Sulfur carrier protein adenylyltransferase ThiF [hydrothermal vent metagenome]|uniref:Sulfur carrier protein adenylyltransferase ThiF n=1 Tax=hydrothermal vent metagenome TaxID=652676 RepID=A0A3B0YYB7_9ZZZZ